MPSSRANRNVESVALNFVSEASPTRGKRLRRLPRESSRLATRLETAQSLDSLANHHPVAPCSCSGFWSLRAKHSPTFSSPSSTIGPGAGQRRPLLCLSNADGTCPAEWLSSLGACLERTFGVAVSLNHPFRGGYVIRHHAAEMPWVQLELSRAAFLSSDAKRAKLVEALAQWCRAHAD